MAVNLPDVLLLEGNSGNSYCLLLTVRVKRNMTLRQR